LLPRSRQARLDLAVVGLYAEHRDRGCSVDPTARRDRLQWHRLRGQHHLAVGNALGVDELRDVVPDRELELGLCLGRRTDHGAQILHLARLRLEGFGAHLRMHWQLAPQAVDAGDKGQRLR